jgi:TonB-linked SusC/RagA family outer membrane protein
MKSIYLFCILAICACPYLHVSAQQKGSALTEQITLIIKDKPVPEILKQIEKQTGVSFAYSNELVAGRSNLSINQQKTTVKAILDIIFPSSEYEVKAIGRQIIIKKAHTTTLHLTGTVKDLQTGEALAGATVTAKGSGKTVVADGNGSYKLDVAEGAPLSVAYIGYETTVVTAAATTGDLLIKAKISEMNTVVVTALGINRQQRSLGYAYTDVKGSELTTARETNVMKSLSGKVAGLDVSPTNSGAAGSVKVTLRGVKVIGGDNQPLYVIDGVPMNNSSPGQADTYGGYDLGDGASLINPDEVETISVLKGGAAAALYGSRAANGVILITTKKGSRKGFEVELNSNTVMEQLDKSYDFQDQYGSGTNGKLPRTAEEARGNSQASWGPKLSADSLVWLWNGKQVPYTNAKNSINKFFRTGVTYTNSVTASTGNENSQLRINYTNLSNQDIVPTSGINRHNFSLRGTSQLTKKLQIDAKAAYLTEKVKNRPALSDNPNNIGYVLGGIAPNIDINWLKDYKDPATGNYINWNNNVYQVNPYWAINEQPNSSVQDRLNGFLQLKYQILPSLSIQGRTGTDYSKFSWREFMEYSTPFNQTGAIYLKDRTLRETNSEVLLNFGKQVGQYWIGANAGMNRMDYSENYLNTTGRDISTRGVQSINNFTTKVSNELINRKRMNSVYGALNLAYRNYLYLDITGRNDWSSTLASGNNSFFYPSVSSSFVFTEILKKNKLLTFGKLRFSVAETGSDAVSPYQLKLTYSANTDIASVGGYNIGGVAVDQVPFEKLKPSLSRSYEAGTNLIFFTDRINLDVTWYKSNTKNQVLSAPISSTSGYSTAVINSGNVQNTGIEVALMLKVIKSKSFGWDVNMNFARNRNKILQLSPLVSDYYTLASARWANASIVAKQGEAYGAIVGRKFSRDAKGNMILDAGNLPQYDADDKILGNGQYEWFGGINNRFSYKSFALSVLLDIKHGGSIYSMTNLLAYSNGRQKGTLEGREGWAASEAARVAAGVAATDWTPTGGLAVKGVRGDGTAVTAYVNPQTYWQRVAANIPESFIYDAGFVKLRQLNLDYNLPASLLNNTKIKAIAVSLVARNLWTISKHVPNIDPESSYNNGNGQGFEYGSLPTRHSYGVNIYAKF